MDAEKYNVVFDGGLREGVTLDEAKTSLVKSGSYLAQVAPLLFSGRRSILKRSLSAEEADKFLDALQNAGVLAVKEAIAAPSSSRAGIAPVSDASDSPNGTRTRADSTRKTRPPSSAKSSSQTNFAETKLFSFEGRLGRIRYIAWGLLASMIVIPFALNALIPLMDSVIELGPDAVTRIGTANTVNLFIAIIVVAIFSLSLMVRRLHDMNRSGWWVLVACIPLLAIKYSDFRLGFTLELSTFALDFTIAPMWGFLHALSFLFALLLFLWPGSAGENDYDLPPPPSPRYLYIILVVGIVLNGVVGGYMSNKAIKLQQVIASCQTTEQASEPPPGCPWKRPWGSKAPSSD